MPEWEEASASVIHIAEELIEKYHSELKPARIGFLFRKKAQRCNGRLLLAQAQKVTAKLQVYLEFDFLIWVSKADWEGKLTDKQRLALIDHELAHCTRRMDSGEWALRPHDVQEFWEIIERYGLWSNDLLAGQRALASRAVQAELPLVELSSGGKVVAISPEDVRKISQSWQPERKDDDDTL